VNENYTNEIKPFDKKGLITHIQGQKLVRPVPFKRGDMVVLSLCETPVVVIADIEWIEF
jgi:hypothetical protein